MATIVQELNAVPDEPMPIAKVLRAYLLEIKYETLHALRTPAMGIPFLLIPILVYLLFGVIIVPDEPSSELPPGFGNWAFVGFCVFAVVMPGIFSGVGLAMEREGGLLKLKRALPMPTGANLVSKVITSMLFAVIPLTVIAITALLIGTLTLSVSQVLIIWVVMVLASIPFCAIGFFIGSVTSGAAAPAYSNLVFLPMMWLSGMFPIPLPEFLRQWFVIWPSFHVSQLALGLAGVSEFSFVPPELAAGVLAGITVVFGGLALRRLARVG